MERKGNGGERNREERNEGERNGGEKKGRSQRKGGERRGKGKGIERWEEERREEGRGGKRGGEGQGEEMGERKKKTTATVKPIKQHFIPATSLDPSMPESSIWQGGMDLKTLTGGLER